LNEEHYKNNKDGDVFEEAFLNPKADKEAGSND
jgi:hypothetical protein